MAEYLASIFGTEKDKHTDRISGKPIDDSMTPEEEQQHFDEFFEEVWTELQEKYGDIDELNVCDNLGEHLVGNIYVKFHQEKDASRAVEDLNNRWFDGKPIYAELSPVTDFKEASCRKFELGDCHRGGFCNFMHIKTVSPDVRRRLMRNNRRRRSRSTHLSRKRRS